MPSRCRGRRGRGGGARAGARRGRPYRQHRRCLGFRVQGLGFRVHDLGATGQGVGYRV